MLVEDEALLRAQDGDVVAFEILLRPRLQPALELAYLMVHSRGDAEDVVQEAAVKAWRKIRRVRPDSSFGPWFLGIVANQSKSHSRSRWPRVLLFADVPRQSSADHQADLDLVRALTALSHQQRAAIVLHYYLDLSVEDVGHVLGLSNSGAKSRIHRALARLRRLLGDENEVLAT